MLLIKLLKKEYIAGIMKPKEMAALRDAKVYQKYDENHENQK